MSHNRVNIYLNSKQTADNFVRSQKAILINDTKVTVRLLLSPNKRIVISYACATILHSTIEYELRRMDLKFTSPMNLKREQHVNYGQILIFRRQIFIEDDEKIHMPKSIVITYDDQEYRLFITDDSYYVM